MPPKKGTVKYNEWKNSPQYDVWCAQNKAMSQKLAHTPEWRSNQKNGCQKREQDNVYIDHRKKGYEKRNIDQKFTKMLVDRNIAMAQDPLHLTIVKHAAQKHSTENEGWKTHNKEAMQKRV